jgi:hypothetical protein
MGILLLSIIVSPLIMKFAMLFYSHAQYWLLLEGGGAQNNITVFIKLKWEVKKVKLGNMGKRKMAT